VIVAGGLKTGIEIKRNGPALHSRSSDMFFVLTLGSPIIRGEAPPLFQFEARFTPAAVFVSDVNLMKF
jgi:hypothetical protein